ncbi:MAG: hypothetical protein MMC33_004612 [Icmadophila ericetorum]|nr:hypothetical protein [Icmadophila ericetorum]
MSTPEQHLQSVKIVFKSLGAYPPVAIAGSFTHPPWQPQELAYMMHPDGTGDAKYEFSKTFMVPIGEWQYKFRLGSGAWICDEILDGAGNRNNLLRVKPQSKPIENKHVYPHNASVLGHEEVHGQSHIIGSPKKSSNFEHKGQHHDDKHPMSTPYSENLDALADNLEARQQLTQSINELSKSMQTGGRQLPVLGVDTPSAAGVDRLPCIPLVPRLSDLPTSEHAPDFSMVPQLSFDSNLTSPESDSPDHDELLPKPYPTKGSPHISGADMSRLKHILSSSSMAGLEALPTPGVGESFLSPGMGERSNSGAALLPHECQTSVDDDQFLGLSPTRSSESFKSAHEVEPQEANMADLLKDPSLEVFPSESEAVLKRIATLHQELREDNNLGIDDLSESPFSPVALPHSPTFSHEVSLSDAMSPSRFADETEDDGALYMNGGTGKRISPLRLPLSARDISPINIRSTRSNRSISSISEDEEREYENYQPPLKERAKSLVEVVEAQERAEAEAAVTAEQEQEQGGTGYATPFPKASHSSEDDQVQGLRQRGVSRPSPVISMASIATSQQPINDVSKVAPREADWRVGAGFWRSIWQRVVGFWRFVLDMFGLGRKKKQQSQKLEQKDEDDPAVNA